MITSIITIISTIWTILSLGLKIVSWLFVATADLLEFILAVLQALFIATVDVLTWFKSWLGPVARSIWGTINSGELWRAFLLALGYAGTALAVLGVVFKDGWSLLTNPFLLNIATTIGVWGMAGLVGTFTFLVDIVRRLFQGIKL